MFKHIAHNFSPLSPSDPFSDACMFKPGDGCSRALLIPFERKSSEFQIFCAGFSHTQCLIMSSVSGLSSGWVKRFNPESEPLQPNHQAFGAEVHPLPSSG